jgi:hypothetical protein
MGSSAAKPEERMARGLLVALLTVEGDSAVEAIEAPARWRPLWSSKLDKKQQEQMRFLSPTKLI